MITNAGRVSLGARGWIGDGVRGALVSGDGTIDWYCPEGVSAAPACWSLLDPAGGAVRRLANGDWFVRGHVAVSDLPDYGLELPVDTDAYNSVGGFVFAELGRLPKRGDTIAANGFSIRVESVRQNRIEAVRIRQRRVAA